MKKMLAILLAALMLLAGVSAVAETGTVPEGTVVETEAVEPTAQAVEPDKAAEDAELEAAGPDGASDEADDAGAAGEGEPEDETNAAEAEPETDSDAAGPGTAEETFRLWFEEGFGLSIPAGWYSYPVSEADRAAGLRYILGDGQRYLYVQAQPTRLADAGALSALVEENGNLEKTGDLTFGGTPFVAFIDRDRDISGCAALWGREIIAFLFTPQSNSAFMGIATNVMESFAAL